MSRYVPIIIRLDALTSAAACSNSANDEASAQCRSSRMRTIGLSTDAFFRYVVIESNNRNRAELEANLGGEPRSVSLEINSGTISSMASAPEPIDALRLSTSD